MTYRVCQQDLAYGELGVDLGVGHLTHQGDLDAQALCFQDISHEFLVRSYHVSIPRASLNVLPSRNMLIYFVTAIMMKKYVEHFGELGGSSASDAVINIHNETYD